MPNSATFAALVETATKCFATAAGAGCQAVQQPIAGAVGVGHRLQRGERLRGDDEQRLGRVEIACRFDEIGAVDVGDEAEGARTVAVILERLIGHHRAEVGAADADVDDVADRLAGVPLPRAGADAVGEVGHLVEHGVYVGHDVLAVHDDGRAARRTQRHVQHGTVLGDVDLLAAEHRVDPLAQPAFLGELQQQLQRLVGDAILRVVEVDADGLGRQPLAALGIVGEELAQVDVAHLAMMRLQSLPGGPCGERCGGRGHRCWSFRGGQGVSRFICQLGRSGSGPGWRRSGWRGCGAPATGERSTAMIPVRNTPSNVPAPPIDTTGARALAPCRGSTGPRRSASPCCRRYTPTAPPAATRARARPLRRPAAE